ncbi:hypothetical protein [Lacticaseibacillus brantae]|uniref:DUF2187 domain-containing protein n=1 Tax=Lacticaseibacillus brantae DSM 23927 TaxID=1423727 RepID=A0A0R2AXY0_9LACO|nr:hypothetical protein [Lacticaseibacillus brantae]KRM71330.1 hypothetical protein FC34_GL001810 [Lacticaseibacillus brantae DSM 23927]
MEKDQLHLGDSVICHVQEDMAEAFTGTIEKAYVNSALLSITDYQAIDKPNVAELNEKIIVNFKGMDQNLGGGSGQTLAELAEEKEK